MAKLVLFILATAACCSVAFGSLEFLNQGPGSFLRNDILEEHEDLQASIVEHSKNLHGDEDSKKWLGDLKASASDAMMYFDMERADDCKTCINNASQHIMDYVWDKVNKKCASTKCPKLKKICDFIKGHKEETSGFIMEKIHPRALAASWCCGHGECRKEAMEDSMPFMPLDTECSGSGCAAGIESSIGALLKLQSEKHVGGTSLGEVHNYESRDSDSDSATQVGEFEFVSSPHEKKGKCAKCVRRGVKFVMGHVIEEVKKICEKSKCPVVKEHCKWAEAHKKEAVGYIYGFVEPWKYAVGYCYGKGKCKGHPHEDISNYGFPIPIQGGAEAERP